MNDDFLCPFGGLGFVANDIWFAYTPPEDGLLTISLCNGIDWDSDLVLYIRKEFEVPSSGGRADG